MTFLNGILAVGAAAAAIPLLIHLLNRSRFRTIPWGAMHLLESVVRTNNRRIRLEQLLLLLVRCAIPAVLALCLARPVLTGWQVLPGDVPASTVILVDNSYSMDARSNGRTRFDVAIDEAATLAEQMDRRSDIAAIATGGVPSPLLDRPVLDPQIMANRLRHLAGGFGASATVDSLEAGIGLLATMAHARRQLVLVSDFQAADWQGLSTETAARLRTQLDAMPVRPSLTFVKIGEEVLDNVSIDSLDLPQGALGVGQSLQFRANLRNHGPRSYPAARVVLRMDGKPQATSVVALEANAAAQVLFSCRLQSAGSHVVEVEAEVDDRLATDNACAASVTVLEQIDVLLVDGAPSAKPLESETDFLAVALTPYTFGRVKLTDLLQTRTVAAKELGKESVQGARVIVLANVPRLTDEQAELLTEYVRGGGSLLVFLGNKIDMAWYNQKLCTAQAGLLPMPLAALEGSTGEKRLTARVVAQHFEHPALEIFNDRSTGNLADAEIWNWYRLARGEDRPARSSDPAAVVMARLETGDPLMVERRYGAGLVVQVATACDTDWSSLPMQPAFLPLMQQLVSTMACQVMPSRNIQAGDPLVAVLPADAAGVPLALQLPDGLRHTFVPAVRGSQSVVQFAGTGQPGVYTLTGPDARPIHFVALAPRSESDLRLLTSEQLSEVAGQFGADVVGSAEQFLELDRTRRHGREIWRFLLAAVVILMFTELVLQQRFARVRP
ncbi:MAG: BatA domain-containing protein [Thermoguttaceae bacterium]